MDFVPGSTVKWGLEVSLRNKLCRIGELMSKPFAQTYWFVEIP